MSTRSIAEIKANTDIVEFIGRYVSLKREGPEWVGNCPFHDEKSASFKVNPVKSIFKCFGCGKGGSVIDFLVFQGKTVKEARDILDDPNNTAAIVPGVKEKKPQKEKKVWLPVPAVRMDGMTRHPTKGLPVKIWEYFNEDGALIGLRCRFPKPDGGKEVLPLIYATDGRVTKWVYTDLPKPYPMYNLHKLKARPTAPVLLVEGEKTAEKAETLFPKAVVTTWWGGGNGAKYVDFSPLDDREVVMWPDNDKPGIDVMHFIYAKIKDKVELADWMRNPPDAEKGWDVGDAEWTIEEAAEYAKHNIMDYPGENFKYEIHINPPPVTETSAHEIVEDISEVEKESKTMLPVKPPDPPVTQQNPEEFPLWGTEFFRMLGSQKENNNMIYYFYSYSTKTVIGLTPAGMTKANLMQLAPLNWWKNTFLDHRNTFAIDYAANYLINKCSEFGTFTDKWIRGRGAWMDGDDVVMHAGDKLIVNGVEKTLREYKSKYIYEVGEELGFAAKGRLNVEASSKLIALLKLLKWERSVNAVLLAGFCVVAPICGALPWRPHAWLTGAAGTGKTTLFNLIKRLLGEAAVKVEGETTEPGLRQTLGHDALPIVFDEAEGEDRRSQDRMQSVLASMRTASSFGGGKVAKGGSSGVAKTYQNRSCYIFASIAVPVVQQSDRTRITILSLLKNKDADAQQKWEAFQQSSTEVNTDEYAAGLRSRTISLVPTILYNAKIFKAAVTSVLGEARVGDQLGVLLAGAYSLVSEKKIEFETAVKFLSDKDWEEEKALSETRDEMMLISFLLEQPVRIETQSATVVRTVGELALMAFLIHPGEWNINDKQANAQLERIGIKVKDDYLYVSDSDMNLQKMLVNTAWSRNHGRILSRLDGAEKVNSERFASGFKTRAVRIPKTTLFGDLKRSDFNPIETINPADEVAKPQTNVYTENKENLDLPF